MKIKMVVVFSSGQNRIFIRETDYDNYEIKDGILTIYHYLYPVVVYNKNFWISIEFMHE